MVPQDKKKAMLIDVDSSNSYWKNWENSFHLRRLLSVIPPYLCRSFLKNHKRGGLNIFLQKKEENNPYMGVVCRRGQHCFLLVMYGFYSKNPLYSASLLFTMFIGPPAVVRRVLQNRISPPIPLSGYFLVN